MQHSFFILLVIALTNISGVEAARLSCKKLLHLSTQISNPWHRISSDLNILYAQYSLGVNQTTLELTAAFNAGLIGAEAIDFAAALIAVGVDPTIAENAATQLNLYALASENYAIAVMTGGDVSMALETWNLVTENLIAALTSIPHLNAEIIISNITQFKQNEIASIQSFAIQNFSEAVNEHEEGQNFADAIGDYIANQLVPL